MHHKQRQNDPGNPVFGLIMTGAVVAAADYLTTGGQNVAPVLVKLQEFQSWLQSLQNATVTASAPAANSIAGAVGNVPAGTQCLMLIGAVIVVVAMVRLIGYGINATGAKRIESTTDKAGKVGKTSKPRRTPCTASNLRKSKEV
jgi:hypothetical protein